MNLDEIRQATLSLHALPGTDAELTFHYDETNNIRRLVLAEGALNVRRPGLFVLGGVVHPGAAPALPFAELQSSLTLQPSTTELKLKHLGRGDFWSLMNSPAVARFLGWLLDRNVWLHYQVLSPLYWSLVDIVDSIIFALGQPELFIYADHLKNRLYAHLRSDPDVTAALLHRYNYPDIAIDECSAFIEELRSKVRTSAGDLLPQDRLLDDVLSVSAANPSLPFLEGETANVLIDGFAHFYIDRIALFPNARHFLDIEPVIEAHLSSLDMKRRDGAPPAMAFVDSKHHPWIQVADAIVGLLGKLFTEVHEQGGRCSKSEADLTDRQRECLGRLRGLIDRSDAQCPAFIQHITPVSDRIGQARLLSLAPAS